MIIAIDGPAGSGKSTTARRVADRLGHLYLDTGAMYRAVALAFIEAGREPTADDAREVLPQVRIDVDVGEDGMHVMLDGEDVTDRLRTPAVSEMASRVSALRAVRDEMVRAQRRIGHRYREEGGGVVIDGRDIGTVVFPDADLKVFMIAEAEERARRRLAEMQERGEEAAFENVLSDIERRDRMDTERTHAPLRQADDALPLDTTEHTIGSQVDRVVAWARERQNAVAR